VWRFCGDAKRSSAADFIASADLASFDKGLGLLFVSGFVLP